MSGEWDIETGNDNSSLLSLLFANQSGFGTSVASNNLGPGAARGMEIGHA